MSRFFNFIKYKILFNKTYNPYEKTYISLIVFFIIYSCFIGIPTDTTNIGVSSPVLGIGDRVFYINDSTKGFGYQNYQGNVLYPIILRLITNFTNLFGQDEYSNLWNLTAILITSCLSIISLRLLRITSLNFFNQKVSNIASLIFLLNPYTYYYSLSGGITNYIIVGVTYILYIFSKGLKSRLEISFRLNLINFFSLILTCVYLSFLRPNGGIFAFIILLVLLFKTLCNIKSSDINQRSIFIKSLFTIIGILLVYSNLKSTIDYSLSNLSLFSNEGGLFFGYPREDLRNKLNTENIVFFNNLKSILYIILWKITDFVSGMSDIRDTFLGNPRSVLPFLIRTFTGIFILFPVNLFSFLGIIFNLKLIFRTELWIVLLASLIAISPSMIGIAMSRYLMMFYTPFILFSAKMFHDTLLGIEKSKIQ